eukprot:CAMPEP_0194392056 /NCGR_PEP_ID=MMETSP0174-20130528/119457_1 /TAXON_ID=216777 /ORGANISM="Proboscia alata, Strain PI-D3" /LENGTH=264 /DNA_ID=CAMNT_0039187035 /DNA_START=18 /DNA_END=809 /DNA_ORIENTATION=+
MRNDFCITSIEGDLHATFARARIADGGADCIFAHQEHVFSELTSFCESSIKESKDGSIPSSFSIPLVLSGPSGIGKSAVLANWIVRFEAESKRAQSIMEAGPFIFWHCCGSSRNSTYVSHLFRRLMKELKKHFELNIQIDERDDRLPWDFPRFLEIAAKKGRIVLIIDGVHRIQNEDGEVGLKWLPLNFPPNVKVILSLTSPSKEEKISTGQCVHKEREEGKLRILHELKRRNWRIIELAGLEKGQCEKIIDDFRMPHIAKKNK